MSEPNRPKKISVSAAISDEFMLYGAHFPRKGHIEEITLTDEDIAAHARAVEAHREVMGNDWIDLSGYDYTFEVRPLKPRTVFIAEETPEEHMARWVAEGRPMRDPLSEIFKQSMHAFMRKVGKP